MLACLSISLLVNQMSPCTQQEDNSVPNWGALTVESLVLLRHDIELLKSRGRREFATMVGLQFHHLQYDLKPQIQAALEDATSVPMGDFGKEASRNGLAVAKISPSQASQNNDRPRSDESATGDYAGCHCHCR